MQIAGMPLSGEHGAAFAKVKCSALGHKGPGTEAAGQAWGGAPVPRAGQGGGGSSPASGLVRFKGLRLHLP